MQCKQCATTFLVSLYIKRCGECQDEFCTKCLSTKNGVCYCPKCAILTTRPPDIDALMTLTPKDMQEYLNRHNIATYSLDDKRELVDILCSRSIPVKNCKHPMGLNKIFRDFDSVLNLDKREHRRRPPDRPVDVSTGRGDPEPSTSTAGSRSVSEPGTSRAGPSHASKPDTSTGGSSSALVSPSEAGTSSADFSPAPPKSTKLADYPAVEDLHVLSVQELRVLLRDNLVDHEGGKEELLERAEHLWRYEEKLRSGSGGTADDLCILCVKEPMNCVLLKCGHVSTCITCWKKVETPECPICRQYVVEAVRLFRA